MKKQRPQVNTQPTFKVNDFIITILVCVICIILVGYIFWGDFIFDYGYWNFMVISYGISGAAILSTLKYRNVRDSIFVSVLCVIGMIILYQSKTFLLISRDTLFSAALFAGIYFYFTWFMKIFQGTKYFRALGLAFLLAIFNLLAGLIQILLIAYIADKDFSEIRADALVYIKVSTVIGLGLGIGLDLSEWLIRKYKKLVREGKYKKQGA